MGKFTGWDVKADAAHKCSNCGMQKEKKKGCCNDEQATIELKKDQLASTINDVPGNQFVYIHHYISLYNNQSQPAIMRRFSAYMGRR
jgi:predicted ATP-dependent serine protease